MLIDLREGKRNINRLPLVRAPIGDQTCNLGMYPDGELNPRPFGLQDDAPSEPHWPWQEYFNLKTNKRTCFIDENN